MSTKTVRVNVKSKVVNSAIRFETRNGQEVVVVPSATMPDDIVMNNIFYPKEETAKSWPTLEKTPAPLGHPKLNGMFVSANDPEARAIYDIGAWNENVRREHGRVFLEKVINVNAAKRTEQGQRLLDAINNGQPIHTSTGIWMDVKPEKGANYTGIASNMRFDHDAILLDEPGAATPDQGVGMLVNSEGKSEEIDAINVEIPEHLQDTLAMFADEIVGVYSREQERQRNANMRDKLVGMLKSFFTGIAEQPPANVVTNGEVETMDKEQFEQLLSVVNGLATTVKDQSDKLDSLATNQAEQKTALDTLTANTKAEEEARRTKATEVVVNANLLDEDTAKDTPLATLERLAANCEGGKPAPGVSGREGDPNAGDGKQGAWNSYDFNANLKDDDKGAK